MRSRSDLKLILMSATLNSKLFSAYFGGCPVVKIPGFTYPVQTYFLVGVVASLLLACFRQIPTARCTQHGGLSNQEERHGEARSR